MRIVAQRVERASVTVAGREVARIGGGLLLLVAFTHTDSEADLEWMVNKVCHLRVFNDAAGVMNVDLLESGGDLLAVSQFTLYARTRKGNRPSYVDSAPGGVAEPLFEEFVGRLSKAMGRPVPCGVFGADMQVELVNDGPVTIIIDSPERPE